MDHQCDNAAKGFGLLANGSSRLWDITIDESLCRANEWIAEIEGPDFYLVFQLSALSVVSRALSFLERSGGGDRYEPDVSCASDAEMLVIGQFGATSDVSLVRDDEDSDRCFLVVGPAAGSTNPLVGKPVFNRPTTMRRTLRGEDMTMLIEALRQVVEDLPH